jgi:hypothetical protein
VVGIIRTDTWTDNEGTERRGLRVVVDAGRDGTDAGVLLTRVDITCVTG